MNDTRPLSQYAQPASDDEGEVLHEYACLNRQCSEFGMQVVLGFAPSQMRLLTGSPATCDTCERTLGYSGPINGQ